MNQNISSLKLLLRTTLRIILLGLLITAAASVAKLQSAGQWLPTSGPSGGVVTALLSDGANLFAGTDGGGVYRSGDLGQSWVTANTGLSNLNVRALVISGANLFAGTANGVFRSTNNGQIWTAVNTGLTDRGVVALAANDIALFAATSEYSVFRSVNNGQGWTQLEIPDSASGFRITSLAANGTTILAGTDSSLSPFPFLKGNFFRSLDNGQTWTVAGADRDVFFLSVIGQKIFAGVNPGKLIVSSDNLQTVVPVSDGLPDGTNVTAVKQISEIFFAATSKGVFRSVNGGQSWTEVNNNLNDRDVRSLAVQSTHLFAGVGGGRVWLNNSLLPTTLASISAASYSADLASESIVAAFGANLAPTTQAATTIPLPTQLAGTTVQVRDSAGTERLAPLFFVSAGQVNYQIPSGTTTGAATVTITSGNGSIAIGTAQIATVAPGLFSANADGQGVPAGYLLRYRNGQQQALEAIIERDAQNRFVTRPIDPGAEGDELFLVLFGTGIRFHSGLSGVTASIGGENAEVLFAGAQPDFIGLDQLNLRLPRSLAGRGEVDVSLTVQGKTTNTVKLRFK